VNLESEVFKSMQETPCMWFEIDSKHCDETVMLTPGGPMCISHQKHFWRTNNR
jgi:hypothetical protein